MRTLAIQISMMCWFVALNHCQNCCSALFSPFDLSTFLSPVSIAFIRLNVQRMKSFDHSSFIPLVPYQQHQLLLECQSQFTMHFTKSKRTTKEERRNQYNCWQRWPVAQYVRLSDGIILRWIIIGLLGAVPLVVDDHGHVGCLKGRN